VNDPVPSARRRSKCPCPSSVIAELIVAVPDARVNTPGALDGAAIRAQCGGGELVDSVPAASVLELNTMFNAPVPPRTKRCCVDVDVAGLNSAVDVAAVAPAVLLMRCQPASNRRPRR